MDLYIFPHLCLPHKNLVLLDIGKEVEVGKENKERHCICTHGLKPKKVVKMKRKIQNFMRLHTSGTILG